MLGAWRRAGSSQRPEMRFVVIKHGKPRTLS